MGIQALFLAGLAALTVVSAAPIDPRHPPDNKPFVLRTMPLGASITVGLGSRDGNGYRNWLRQHLRSDGWQVNMVGSHHNGTMCDNQYEANSGDIISKVAEAAEKTIPEAPNLILINAGTNDAAQNLTEEADQRMGSLLDTLFDSIPGTTVILSTLLPNRREYKQRNAKMINEKYRQLVETRRKNHDRIVLAEMAGQITVDDLGPDGTHPSDDGYKKMAGVWWTAFQEVEKEGMLTPPEDNGVNDHVCR